MKIAVRIDDITSDMDWDSFYQFKELLDRYGIKPLLGVVPDNKDENLQKSSNREDFWNYLQQLQTEGWSIALHGLHHIYTTSKGGIFPLNHFSEFAGVPYEKQKEMLQQGTDIFAKKGIKTSIFMAPGHSYDRNTLKLLRELGYQYITDGFGKTPYLDKKSQMIFLPIAFQSRKDIHKASGYTTLVYHINEARKEQFAQWEQLFQEYSKDFIVYSELLQIIPKKRTSYGRIKEKSMANFKFFMVRLREIMRR